MNDGTKLGGSKPILRMLAMKYGYYPDDPLQAYHCDSLLDGYEDVLAKAPAPFLLQDGPEKDEKIKEIFENILPKFLKVVEDICGKGTKFLVGDELTVADFWVGGLYTNFVLNNEIPFAKDQWASCVDSYPNFKAYGERFVAANAKYLESRPKCPV